MTAIKPARVQLVGIFPNTFNEQNETSNLSCSNFILENIKLTQAMIYTIDNVINDNPRLLPNVQVGWILLDSCSSSKLTVGILSLIIFQQQRKVLGRIVMNYTSSHHYSQISFNYLNRISVNQPANDCFYDTSLPKNLYWKAILKIITYF